MQGSLYLRRLLTLFFIASISFLCFATQGYSRTCLAENKAVLSPISSASPTSKPEAFPMIGQVVWVKGNMKAISPDKKERFLKRRDSIFLHDTVMTETGSTGQIVFTDGSSLSLQEKTELVFESYQFGKEGSSQENKYGMGLVKGGFRTITGAISKANPNGYQISTPVATIGVRGTVYRADYNLAEGKLSLKIEEGAIIAKNNAGSVQLNKAIEQVYAIVSSPKLAPIVEKTEPSPFKKPLPLIPAKAPVVEASTTTPHAAGVLPTTGGGGPTSGSTGGSTPSTEGSGETTGTGSTPSSSDHTAPSAGGSCSGGIILK
jgi:hypothetical protein